MERWTLFVLINLLGVALANSVACTGEEGATCSGVVLPRIAFLVLVHNKDTLAGCQRLVEALYHEDHTFYVHFDTKMPPAEYSYEWRMMALGRKANMRKIALHDLKWGSWAMLAPWFSVANILVKEENRQWDYFINLSGDSYPVLTPEALRLRLVENGVHLNYMTCSAGISGLRPTAWSQYDKDWHKRKAFPFPIVGKDDRFQSLEAFYGSQWMVVTRNFTKFVLEEKSTPGTFTNKLADWFENGSIEIDTGRKMMKVKPHIPDEIFFPSVLMNSATFNGSMEGVPSTVPDYRLPLMRDMWYVRMDEHYPWSNFNQRYESPPGSSTRAWGPYYVGAYDLGNVKKSGALFVRKVSSQVDENVLRILPVEKHENIPDLFWPSQLPPLSSQSLDGSSAPPAPAPGPELPGVKVMAKGGVGHVNKDGCVHVAESIHCPPKHNIDAEMIQFFDLPVGAGYGG